MESRLDSLIIWLGDKLALLFIASVLISVLEIVLRYVFQAPTIWAHETTILFCALCFIYGGAYCFAQDKHIRIDVVYQLLSPALKKIVDLLSSVLCFIYFSTISYAAWFVARSSLVNPLGQWRPETSGSAWDPAFPAIVRSFLFCVLVLMLVQAMLKMFSQIMKIKNV